MNQQKKDREGKVAEHVSKSKPVISSQLMTHTLKAVIELRKRGRQVGGQVLCN